MVSQIVTRRVRRLDVPLTHIDALFPRSYISALSSAQNERHGSDYEIQGLRMDSSGTHSKTDTKEVSEKNTEAEILWREGYTR